jgi:hypothetical protein
VAVASLRGARACGALAAAHGRPPERFVVPLAGASAVGRFGRGKELTAASVHAANGGDRRRRGRGQAAKGTSSLSQQERKAC